jgi:hypothetical protein
VLERDMVNRKGGIESNSPEYAEQLLNIFSLLNAPLDRIESNYDFENQSRNFFLQTNFHQIIQDCKANSYSDEV